MLKHKIFTGMALAGALFLGSACNDEWDDHYQDKGVNSNLTILELIKSDSELENFCAVLDACGVSDSLLNQSRVYTLWAPVIDDRTRDSLIERISSGARDTVFTRFIGSHISNYMHIASGNMNNNAVRLLNEKVLRFNGSGAEYTFGGVPLRIAESNVRARNGVLHKIEKSVAYAINIWEYLSQDTRLDSLRKYLYYYDKRDFNEYLSTPGPIINGVQTYIDSVFVNSNKWFYSIGYLAAEDSLYNMFAITNNVWEKMVPFAESYYNFYRTPGMVEHYDSIQYHQARHNLIYPLVFNVNDQRPEYKDSIKSTFYDNKKFIRKTLISGVIDSVELSNGKVYIMDEFKYSPYDLWFDTIKVEGEVNYEPYVTSNHGKNCVAGEVQVMSVTMQNPNIKGKISGYGYGYAVRSGETAKPTMEYKIPGTLSGKYRIAVVVVPANITNSNLSADALKPSRIRVDLRMRDGNGAAKQIYSTNNGYELTSQNIYKSLVNDPTRIDTLYLYDTTDDKVNKNPTKRVPYIFDLGYCEQGIDIDDVQAQITLTSDLKGKTENTNFDRDLRIDCILLEPVIEESEEDNE